MPSDVTSDPSCKLPAERSAEGNDSSFLIRDGFPLSRVHSWVMPRRHVASFSQISRAEHHSFQTLLAGSGKPRAPNRERLQQEYSPDGFSVGINDGRAAGPTMMHVRMHSIPRCLVDVPDPVGGIRWVLPAAADYWSHKV